MANKLFHKITIECTTLKDVKYVFDHFIEFMQSLLTFFYNITLSLGFPNYGIAIILLTLVIKTILFPLAAKQTKSMNAMKSLNPQLKILQEKYKDDKVQLQKEISLLYKEAKITPLAGCLPLLVQMPILSGMFYALRNYNYVSHPGFLWIKTLSGYDHLYILPLLAALTTYFSSQQSLPATTSNEQSKVMLLIMPFFVGYMTMNFPAGLGLYWVMGNLIQMLQQYFLQKT
ncbi:MAG: membrane protein insertase YidC [Sporomusaceae bacterium]|nr:membrane protein insertase YidC [Sporomusaceae bacterium]